MNKSRIMALALLPLLVAACGSEEAKRGGYRMVAIETSEADDVIERTVFSYAVSGRLARVTVFDAKGTADTADDTVKYYSSCAYQGRSNQPGFRDLTIEYRNDRVPLEGQVDYPALCHDGSVNSDQQIDEAMYTPAAEGDAADVLVASLSLKKTATGSLLTQKREGEDDILRPNIYTLDSLGGLQTIATTEVDPSQTAWVEAAYLYAFDLARPTSRTRLTEKNPDGSWKASSHERQLLWEYPNDINRISIRGRVYRNGWFDGSCLHYVGEDGLLVREEIALAPGGAGWCDLTAPMRINKIEYVFVENLR